MRDDEEPPLGAGPALAHSKMSGSTPAKGETVPAGLETLALTFDRKVRLTRVVLDQAPASADLAEITASMAENPGLKIKGAAPIALTSKLPKGFLDSLEVKVDSLDAGVYVLRWIALAEDGHTMKGAVPFSVSAAD